MQRLIAAILLLACAGAALAQEQEDRRSKESYSLELKYAEDNWKVCRMNVADLWERGNTLEREVKRLREELAHMKAPDKAKEAPDAPPAQ